MLMIPSQIYTNIHISLIICLIFTSILEIFTLQCALILKHKWSYEMYIRDLLC